MTLKIVIYDEPPLDGESIATIRRTAPDAIVSLPSAESVADELRDAEVFFGYHSPEVFRQARKLKWIQATSAGMDGVLEPQLVGRGLIICNASGVHAPQVAEMAWALTLSIARNLPEFQRQQHKHIWKPSATPLDLADGTAGIVGLGGIGRYYARAAHAFGMRVLAVDQHEPRKPDFVESLSKLNRLDEMLEAADIVLIACPLTTETHHLIDRRRLALMKPSAILINIARGGIVDEGALIECLNSGHLTGAGLDVCETEPLPPESPLWDTPRLVISPHCAGTSSHRQRRLTTFFCENLKRYVAGEKLLNAIDQQKGYPLPV